MRADDRKGRKMGFTSTKPRSSILRVKLSSLSHLFYLFFSLYPVSELQMLEAEREESQSLKHNDMFLLLKKTRTSERGVKKPVKSQLAAIVQSAFVLLNTEELNEFCSSVANLMRCGCLKRLSGF